MNPHTRQLVLRVLDRAIVGVGIILGLLLFTVPLANATELVPFVGLTRPVHSDDDEVRFSGGLALRSDVSPALQLELAGMYRTEEREGGDLDVRQWPLTASLWLLPVRQLYLGGGAGWYYTTYDWEDETGFESQTEQQFGVHLGGGLKVPLGSAVALDLNGRYVFLDDVEQKISTERMDPDFWTTSLGIAFRF